MKGFRILSDSQMSSRPPWKDPDPNPDDLDRAQRALLNDVNPNAPAVPKSLMLQFTRNGRYNTKHNTLYSSMPSFGLENDSRKSRHRAIEVRQCLLNHVKYSCGFVENQIDACYFCSRGILRITVVTASTSHRV